MLDGKDIIPVKLVNEIFDIYAEILKAWNIDKEDR